MTVEGEDRAHAVGRVGERLRESREAQDMTLEAIARSTRVPIRHLRMIEDGDYRALPAATYSAGFVKAYARLLGLDGQTLSEQFRQEIGSAVVRPHRPEPYAPADPRRTPPLGLAVAALVVALLLGVGFLYWRGSRDQPAELAARGVAPVATAPGPVGAGSLAATPDAMPPPGAAGPVTIAAAEDVWIKVSGSGRTLFMGTLKPGDRYQVPADAVDPLLTTGRPGVTNVRVGTTPIPPVGDPDRAAKDVSLKADALLARVGTSAPLIQPPAGAATPVANAADPVG